jgi:hypothetical protein
VWNSPLSHWQWWLSLVLITIQWIFRDNVRFFLWWGTRQGFVTWISMYYYMINHIVKCNILWWITLNTTMDWIGLTILFSGWIELGIAILFWTRIGLGIAILFWGL